jgi:hypothetical protein
VNRRSFFTYGALGVLTVLSALLASEVALRALKRYATGTTAELGFNEPDDRLGWRLGPTMKCNTVARPRMA